MPEHPLRWLGRIGAKDSDSIVNSDGSHVGFRIWLPNHDSEPDFVELYALAPEDTWIAKVCPVVSGVRAWTYLLPDETKAFRRHVMLLMKEAD